MKRALGVAAVILGAAAISFGSAGLATAQGTGGKGKTGGSPPGNNGTIKIDKTLLVDAGKVDHANHPHVSCQFAVSFFGFDAQTDKAIVQFTAQPPSGKFQPVHPTLGRGSFPFEGHGPGNSLDWSELYQLDVTGLKANPNQGYHIKVDVEVTDAPLPNKSAYKYKVFWYEPCSVPTTTTTTASTTTTTAQGATTTTTTFPPSSTSIPQQPTTTVASTTTTTIKHGTTTTTSTTLTPTSSTVPETGTTTTVPTTTTTIHASATTAPPTTTQGSGGQTGSSSTTPPPTGTASSPQSPSGLAFTNGPTPSGAGTDLGFFNPIGSSPLPWVLIIVGGVLFSGAGTVSLTGTHRRKWITRA